MQVPKRYLNALCVLLTLGVAVACLYPFNVRPENHVRIKEGQGLQFIAPAYLSKGDLGGIAVLNGILCKGSGFCRPGEISIELRLSPASEIADCLKRIVDFRGPDGSELFFVGQWKKYLIVRSFSDASSERSSREIGLAGALVADKAVSVMIASGLGGTSLSLDGELAKAYPDFRILNGATSLLGVQVTIGNASDLSCPWSGVVQSLALHGRDLAKAGVSEGRATEASPCAGSPVACYDFGSGTHVSDGAVSDRSGNGNDLSVDAHLAFDKPVLQMPDLRKNLIGDVVANVIGFIPIGAVFSLWYLKVAGRSKAQAAGLGWLSGTVLSLVLEVLQAWLPGRDSSMLDLLMNASGSALGALIFVGFAWDWFRIAGRMRHRLTC